MHVETILQLRKKKKKKKKKKKITITPVLFPCIILQYLKKKINKNDKSCNFFFINRNVNHFIIFHIFHHKQSLYPLITSKENSKQFRITRIKELSIKCKLP